MEDPEIEDLEVTIKISAARSTMYVNISQASSIDWSPPYRLHLKVLLYYDQTFLAPSTSSCSALRGPLKCQSAE